MVSSNYDLTRLFVTKEVDITTDKGSFVVLIPTIKDFYERSSFSLFYNILTTSLSQLKKQLGLTTPINSNLELLKLILFHFGQFKEFRFIYDVYWEELPLLIPGCIIDVNIKEIQINNITITEEI